MSDKKDLLPTPSDTNLMTYGKFTFTSVGGAWPGTRQLIRIDPLSGSPSDYTVVVANLINPNTIDGKHDFGISPKLFSTWSPCYLFEDLNKWSFILHDRAAQAQPETYSHTVFWAIIANSAVSDPVLSAGPAIAVKGSFTAFTNEENFEPVDQTVTVSSALTLSNYTVFTSIKGNYSAFMTTSSSNGSTWTLRFKNFRYITALGSDGSELYPFDSSVTWVAVKTSLLV